MGLDNLLFPLLIILSFSTICRSEKDDGTYDVGYCVYTFYVGTGSRPHAGTNSTIHIVLYDQTGFPVSINNIKKWGGLMGPDHNYFQPGKIDVFTGPGMCLPGPVCAITVVSDGDMVPGEEFDYGLGPGWYCSFVDLTTTGLHKMHLKTWFKVEQWIGSEYLPNVTRSLCPGKFDLKKQSINASMNKLTTGV